MQQENGRGVFSEGKTIENFRVTLGHYRDSSHHRGVSSVAMGSGGKTEIPR